MARTFGGIPQRNFKRSSWGELIEPPLQQRGLNLEYIGGSHHLHQMDVGILRSGSCPKIEGERSESNCAASPLPSERRNCNGSQARERRFFAF